MPSKVSDRHLDREQASSEVREKRRHKSSRSKRKSASKGEDEDTNIGLERSSTLADSTTRRRTSMPIPELRRRASSISPMRNDSKTSLPYPSFSKAHSREAVGSKENIVTPRQDIFTPDPTDLQQRPGKQDEKEVERKTTAAAVNGPPSPPLTAVVQAAVLEDKRRNLEMAGEEMRRKISESRDGKNTPVEKVRSSSARNSPFRPSKGLDRSTVSAVHRSTSNTPTKIKPIPVTIHDGSSVGSRRRSRSSSPTPSKPETGTTTSSTMASDSTSIAPKQHRLQQPFRPDADDETSPATGPDSSPRTPTPRGTPFPPSRKQTPAYEFPLNIGYTLGNEASPMPPPPPPPPIVPFQMPKVDYLMYNGGLPHSIPKNFLAAPEPHKVSQATASQLLPNPAAMAGQVEKFFSPFNGLLEDYMKVISKNGSVAVATGYRSIARRLLDRLEAVFSRDISSETCVCIMCQYSKTNHEDLEDERGISWGEILEYVCGRRELPPWPAFALDALPVGLGISATEYRLPMQKLDIDVPEEYRDHYIRQSKKTKQSVDRWLAGQSIGLNNPPEDADDDTLTFAMLTHIEPEQRPIFKELLGIAPTRPGSVRPEARAPTPLNPPRTELLTQTALAIQRLYRLVSPPRTPEAAIYLLTNPAMHNILATLAAISDGEWEILTSGRFDGFLRSGAEDHPSPVQSRNPTPANHPRGTTPLPTCSTPAPASAGAPVAMDEETEIAVLAEVEREIYLGMEALEDAFEALHCKAEQVRQTLRERGAGLSMASQARRGGANTLEARLGTPASGYGGGARGWDSETDDGIDDAASELAPDDSASNVSRSRVRRPKRRNERRTPAPVEEEDEEGEGSEREWDRGGRRRG
ncbi:hypothetical protein MMC34_007424 [Xylographa carneopallida]|nr:hypothetical protein [Xylographa carneopallida]